MAQESEILRSNSPIPYSYATIRLTQSRIDKGLIAIPTPLAKWFPDRSTDIQVYLNDSSVPQSKRYSSYSSSTKEGRIGGVKPWFEANGLRSGDEIVVQLVDKERSIYRLVPERDFVAATQRLQNRFEQAASEREASEGLTGLSKWTNTGEDEVALSEYRRLASATAPMGRQRITRAASRRRETAPPALRALLGQLYRGHCQVCDFWFLKRDNEPYFEIHHLNASAGHHPKNLLVVCGNCHNQFEHAAIAPEFDDEQWLLRVRFNKTLHQVNQIVLTGEMPSFSKELFI